MAITDLLLGEIILTAYIPKILNISSFIYNLYFLSKLYHHESNQFNVFFMSTENIHVSTNLVHPLYRMQSIGTISSTSFTKQMDPKSYK